MPRQLPWKTGNPGLPHQETATRQPHLRAAPSSPWCSPATSAVQLPTSARLTSRSKTQDDPSSLHPIHGQHLTRGRSPSTSPPPEPIPEELMREGVEKDDRYRMVEDEFLALAHDFTRHIHAAEYQRLKGLAKSQNEETIQNISQPVTGDITEMVKKRHAALDTAARQRGVLRKRRAVAGNWGSDDDESNQKGREGGNSLRGLMDSPRKQGVPLISLGSSLGARARGESPSCRRTGNDKGAVNTGRVDMMPATEFASEDDKDDGLDGGSADSMLRRRMKPEKGISRQPRVPTAQNNAAEMVWPSTGDRPSASTAAGSPPTFPRPSAAQASPQRQTTSTHKAIDRDSEVNHETGDTNDDFFSTIRSRRAEMRRRSTGTVLKSQMNAEVGKTSDSQQDRDNILNEIPPFI